MVRQENAILEEKRRALGYPPDVLDKAEFDEIIRLSLDMDYKGVSGSGWACLFVIFWQFGKRISEVVELRTSDLSIRGDMLYVTFRIRKKRGENKLPPRREPVSVNDRYVREYIIPYWESIRDSEEFLFPRPQTKMGHIYPQYVWDYIQLFDLEQPVWTHLFRHTLANDVAQMEGVTAYQFQSMFDWSSLKQADAYLSKMGANLTPIARKREER